MNLGVMYAVPFTDALNETTEVGCSTKNKRMSMFRNYDQLEKISLLWKVDIILDLLYQHANDRKIGKSPSPSVVFLLFANI